MRTKKIDVRHAFFTIHHLKSGSWIVVSSPLFVDGSLYIGQNLNFFQVKYASGFHFLNKSKYYHSKNKPLRENSVISFTISAFRNSDITAQIYISSF